MDYTKVQGAKVLGIVGKDSGHTAKHGDVVVVIPQVNEARVTPLSATIGNTTDKDNAWVVCKAIRCYSIGTIRTVVIDNENFRLRRCRNAF